MKSSGLLYSKIAKFIHSLDSKDISNERKEAFQPLIEYIQIKITSDQPIRINFICTHNSRRSHLAQIWAQTMAHYFKIKNISCYSSGTEATAIFPKVLETLLNTGFQIAEISSEKKPIHSIKYAPNEHPVIAFSKKIEDDFNPKTMFAAIMTCDSANEACPFVPGAEKRIPIMFEDPKIYDNTPEQNEKYQERSTQIATEMLYLFSKINA